MALSLVVFFQVQLYHRPSANMSDSINFRGITLSSLFGKIFDNIILDRYSDTLLSSELQFGFKANHSTNMCCMVMKKPYLITNSIKLQCG